MYWWNTQQLALDLQEGKVTERQKMWYLFVWVLGMALSGAFSGRPPKEHDALTIVVGIVVVLVTIIGFFFCYQANRRGDDKEFVVRFICMSWPVSWRLAAAFIPMLILLLLAVEANFFSGRGQGSLDLIFGLGAGAAILCVVAYYALIRRWLIKISNGQVEAAQTG